MQSYWCSMNYVILSHPLEYMCINVADGNTVIYFIFPNFAYELHNLMEIYFAFSSIISEEGL